MTRLLATQVVIKHCSDRLPEVLPGSGHNQLLLANVVDGELCQQAFDQHAVDFGDDDAVYAPAITL